MTFSLPEPKMLSEGYWSSILFRDSSVLQTTKENENQEQGNKLRETTNRLEE